MAEKDEAPQFNPRHRIVGALIVVALAVILVPLILDERDTPPDLKSVTEMPPLKPSPVAAGESKVVITPVSELAESGKTPVKPDGAAPSSAPAPVADAPAPAVTTPSVPAVESKAGKQAEEMTTPTEKIVKPPKIAKTAKHAAEPEKISKGWVVQVGVYKERANADRLSERLKGQGFKVSTEQVTVEGARATRLRLGPYRDRASALKIQARLEKESGVKAAVYAYP